MNYNPLNNNYMAGMNGMGVNPGSNFGQFSGMNAGNTLAKLNNLILAGEIGSITPEQIITAIYNMANTNEIEIIGRGTNRIAVKVNGDVSPYIDIPRESVIKIPYSIKKGMDDNVREYLCYEYITRAARASGDSELVYLANTLPMVSEVRGFPALIAQELVTPIERSSMVTKYNPDNSNLATVCTSVILNDYKPQYLRLMNALDKYCIFADLNPIVAPFQFGFKRDMNNNIVVTILDTGYTIPRFEELKNLYMNKTLEVAHYIVVGRDIDWTKYIIEKKDGKLLYQLVSLTPTISNSELNTQQIKLKSEGGIYKTDNSALPVDNKYIPDMAYFMHVYKLLKEQSRMASPNSECSVYFGLLRSQKNLNNI